MSPILEAIFQRRAVKVFEPVEIPPAQRELILDAARVVPSSFNIQPYRFYWVESPTMRERSAQNFAWARARQRQRRPWLWRWPTLDHGDRPRQSYLEWVRQRGFQ